MLRISGTIPILNPRYLHAIHQCCIQPWTASSPTPDLYFQFVQFRALWAEVTRFLWCWYSVVIQYMQLLSYPAFNCILIVCQNWVGVYWMVLTCRKFVTPNHRRGPSPMTWKICTAKHINVKPFVNSKTACSVAFISFVFNMSCIYSACFVDCFSEIIYFSMVCKLEELVHLYCLKTNQKRQFQWPA
jgi:hypothetical protein